MSRPDLTDITIVLDRSGSMSSIANDVIGGANRFVEDQKRHPGQAVFSLVQFDHEYNPVHKAIPIGSAPPLTTETYVPRGTTALLDAIGRTIVETGERLSAMSEADRPGMVIFVVQTDGLENASQEYTRDKINEMISRQRDTYSWQFIFLGANQDAIATAASIGIPKASSMTFAPDAGGVKDLYAATSGAVLRSRTSRCAVAYSEDDRKKQERRSVKV